MAEVIAPSKDELNEDFQLKQKFKELDRNHNGMLEMEEFGELLRQKGNEFSDDEVKLLFDSVDRNKTGRIMFDEFVDYIFSQRQPKKLTKKERIAVEARHATSQMFSEVLQVDVHGCAFHPDLNGTFEQAEEFNGRPTFDREYPRSVIFYGWTEGRRKVGWFAAKVRPQKGPVKRYKMFNPSPEAQCVNLCSSCWETPAGERDKRMVTSAVDRDLWDKEVTAGTCLEEELWDGEGRQAEEEEDDGEWEVTPAADDEEQCWEREWWEEVGEGVEDFASEDVGEDSYTHGDHVADDGEEEGSAEPFEDEDFPPGPNALGISLAKATQGVAEVGPHHLVDGWTRLTKVHENPCLFKHIVPEDVLGQTDAVNRWFLCACATVAEYPAWIQSMFGRTTRLTPDGKYTVRLYHPGKKEFVKVVVDDCVPTKEGKPAFTGVTYEGEVWASLIEKAFAKLCCSYKNMQWGSVAYGLLYLCGGGGAESWARTRSGRWKRSYTVWKGKASDTIDRRRAEGVMADGVEIDMDRLWATLREYMEFCYPVACTPEKAKEDESGLTSDWTYSLIATREVQVQNKILRMVRLRNPFSATEWSGRWGDKSQAWEECPIAMNQLKFTPKADATFWMAFSDFAKYFETIDLVRKSLPVQGCRDAIIDTLKRTLMKREVSWWGKRTEEE
uniref:Calmodulin n=1 Tax=Alexandrium andersonii TaxID=327968 RepID=A0A7S2ACI8_9DINO